MSHVTKFVVRMVINRIRRRILHLNNMDKGTGNAIFILRRPVERSVEKQNVVGGPTAMTGY